MFTRMLTSATLALFAAAATAEVNYNPEPLDTGWALYVDNDLLAPGSADRDYTGGLSLTRSGRSAQTSWLPVDGLRQLMDNSSGFAALYRDAAFTRHSQEIGLTVFTPQELSAPALQVGDRPYASLLYVSNTAVNVVPERDVAYLSTFTLGILAPPGVDELQKDLHQTLGSETPEGWNRQISDGGELTARYSLARASRSWSGAIGRARAEITTTVRASVGYLTEASIGFAGRIGDSHTPWWSYNPQLADYAEKSVPITAAEGNQAEHYFWAGINLRARVYNAFLQGQFRDSEQTYTHDELRTFVAEAWLGYTWAFADGWRYAYQIRALSSEIERGRGDRAVVWGGLVISRSY